MAAALMRRRAFAGALASLALLPASAEVRALGRLPLGGSLTLRLPHDTSRLDPFDLFDPLAALVGPSVFEPVYRLDRSGNPYASLADGMPFQRGRETLVRLRSGMQSSRGRALLAHDLVHSVESARADGGLAVLEGVPRPRVDRTDGLVATFGDVDPVTLARALASPVVVLAARTSHPGSPDGTGAFRADVGAERLTLTRNTCAARGPAFLQRVVVDRASDLADPLRAFEARRVDIGWLGAGLHQPRPEAVAFDLGSVGWVVLRTGPEAGAWDTPGVAQRLLDGIPSARLAHLALGAAASSEAELSWGGPPCQLLVNARSAHLVAFAHALASILSSARHEIHVATVGPTDLASRRTRRTYGLMVDVVRPV
ncbi:MAG: hypothetical protein MUF54_16660, partial [Polyangiaceae bacterium]|nr:hypothetical protein [Polyangiaceae bacterium]